MRARLPSRLVVCLVVFASVSFAAQAQAPTETFRWVDFHSQQDQSIVAWVTRSLAVEKWTSIREIGVFYDAALVVTADRDNPHSPPNNDSFTIWNVSLTTHVITPLLTGVNLRWFDWQTFREGAPEELTALYDNCHDCAASTYFTAFRYDLPRHMWAARWLRGGQAVMVWNAAPPSAQGIQWSEVYAVMGGVDGRVLLVTWNHFEYGKLKPPSDTMFRYDVDPITGEDRTSEITKHEEIAAMKQRLCSAKDAIQGLARGQDSPVCLQSLGTQSQRRPVTTPPANNRGQSVPPGGRR